MGQPVTYSTPPPAPDDLPELMPELDDVPELLASGSYLVTRPAATSVSHGVVIPGAAVYFRSTGSLQPTNGQDVQRLPEGLRSRANQVFITNDALRGLDADTAPDQLTIAGVQWECSNVQDWQQNAGYSRVVLTKVPS